MTPIFPTVRRVAEHARWCPALAGDERCDCDFDMNLPDGKTCADCAHFRYCLELFAVNGTNERCDFAPSKFRDKPPAIVVSPFDVIRLAATVGEKL